MELATETRNGCGHKLFHSYYDRLIAHRCTSDTLSETMWQLIHHKMPNDVANFKLVTCH